MAMPRWATPERRSRLVELFLSSKGLCVQGHERCPEPTHYYERHIEGVIRYWVSEDKSQDAAEWQAEQRRLHHCPPYRGFGRRFDPVARVEYLNGRPDYYLEHIGPDPLTHRRIAILRLSSTNVHLFVDVSGVKVGKVAGRKMRRYGQGFPRTAQVEIERLCQRAVSHYWNR